MALTLGPVKLAGLFRGRTEMRESLKRSSAQKGAKAWTVAMAMNRTNDSSVSALQASSEQVVMLHGVRSVNSMNEMIAFYEVL